jgi:transcriptional repressor NrdR
VRGAVTGTSVSAVRCPGCGSVDDKVVDSRQSDDGISIRRRRQCLTCARRFTTFERLEELPLVIVKRSGDRMPFDRTKVMAGVQAAAKARPVTTDQIDALATQVEDRLRLMGGEIPSEEIGISVLELLRELDGVAYVRFASVYKGFDDPADFEHEVAVLTKATEPKRH